MPCPALPPIGPGRRRRPLATYDGITGYHGPTVASRAFTHDSRAALASLTTLDTIDAGLLLPGHGEPFAGTPTDAATQARSAGLR